MLVELSDNEIHLLKLALVVQGKIVIGEHPRPEIMEQLTLQREAFLELTKRFVLGPLKAATGLEIALYTYGDPPGVLLVIPNVISAKVHKLGGDVAFSVAGDPVEHWIDNSGSGYLEYRDVSYDFCSVRAT
jgi:hypothetical protein